MTKPLALLLVLLAVAAPARAGVLSWAAGFEAQHKSLECPGASAANQTVVVTSGQYSGAAAIRLDQNTSITGTCTSGTFSATGTLYVSLRLKIDLTGAIFCTNTSSKQQIATLTGINGPIKIVWSCTATGNDFQIGVRHGSTDAGAMYAMPYDTWVSVNLKVVTHASAGTIDWRVNNVLQGSLTGLNTGGTATDLALRHWRTGASGDSIRFYYDDIVVLDDPTGGWPGDRTYVNMRQGKSGATLVDNQWTKTGCTNIDDCWDQTPPVLTFPGSSYAVSNTTPCDGTGTASCQTMESALWTAGTDPDIPASATGVADIYGCRLDAQMGRNGSSRTYALRYRLDTTGNGVTDGSDTPTNVDVGSLSLDSYSLLSTVFDMVGGTAGAKLTNLEAMEMGGKKSQSGGGELHIWSMWNNCAWSLTPTTAQPPFASTMEW